MKQMLAIVLVAAALMLYGCAGSSPPAAQAPAQPSANGQQPPAGSNQQPAPAVNVPPAPPSGNGQNPQQAASSADAKLIGTKFTDWRYYSMAFQLAPGNITSDQQAQLNVFDVQQAQQPDGSMLVTVKDSQDGDVNNFTVSSGQALYFSDGNPADDTPGSDAALFDDHFVVVDGTGTIVQAFTAP